MRLFHLPWLLILCLNVDDSLQQHEIRCSTPVIENGFVPGDIKEYNEHEVLIFQCNRHYKRAVDRPSRCTRVGEAADWSPTPLCESIKCTLELPLLRGTTYEPANRNLFSPGDKIRVTCGHGYWISAQQGSSAETTCRDDGQWTIRPVCREITCNEPQDQLLSYWGSHWWQVKKLGFTARYNCIPGYRRTNDVTQATCTRDGWTPKPLCEEITCRRKDYPHADIVGNSQLEYKNNDHVNYECKNGYEGRFRITCGENGWRGKDQCRAIQCTLELPLLGGATYEPANKTVFSPGDTVTVTCGDGYWISNLQNSSAETTCKDDRQWTIRPVCKEITCDDPQDQLLSYWFSHWWQVKKLGFTAHYNCITGYRRTNGVTQATCTRDGWTPKPLCEELLGCGKPPFLADGDIKHALKSQYSHDERVEYMCQNYYTMEGEPYRTCSMGEWTGYMRCLKPCIVNEDDMRQRNITLKSSDNKKYLVHDELIEFSCARGVPVGVEALRQRCNGGQLLLPTCL